MEQRLQKIISQAGITSRRKAEELILQGRVEVNGKVVRTLGAKANPEKDHVKLNGRLLQLKQPKIYLMLNKPKGYVTTLQDPEGRPTVIELLKGVHQRVYPIGRLDYDAEGLLLFTNDGETAEHLMHPRYEIPRTYLVKVKGVLEDPEIKQLEIGVPLEDGMTAPCRIEKIRKTQENSWIELTMREGRNRQIKRMMEHAGHPVLKLKRILFAGLELASLETGEYRYLTEKEIQKIKKGGRTTAVRNQSSSRRLPSNIVRTGVRQALRVR
jgi:23S rRNA pseudouridine2605 synthase